MKARFQHIREAKVLDFEVDPYTDIDMAELSFSLDDLQYLRHHFKFFSAVSLFGLMADEKDRVAHLDAYLDIRNTRITYEERARKALQGQSQTPETNGLEDDSQKEARLGYMSQEQVPVEAHDDHVEDALMPDAAVINNPEDDDQDPTDPLVVENMEISMVHVLLAEFQPTAHQPNFLDGDVVTEEVTQVDFVATAEDG
ncbi:hypothetical protein ACFX13_012280 [Malus domestica]